MTRNGTEQRTGTTVIAPAVLVELAAAFGIGEVNAYEYLPAGLMNRNWRLEAEAGVFALKEFCDTSRTEVRRNLAVAAQLGRLGLPVPAPRSTVGGDLIAVAAGSEWCLLPWAFGMHHIGEALTADEVRQLGGVLGAIHEGLKVIEGLPKSTRPRPRSVTAADAMATVERFAERIAVRREPDTFDQTAALLLAQRLALIERFADQAPQNPGAGEPFGWTHGDFQHLNIIWDRGAVVAVFDWDRVKPQFLADEVARAAVIHCRGGPGGLDLNRIAAFASGYRSQTRAAVDLGTAADRLWWRRLTDVWQLVFHYDRDDVSCDHLFLEGEPVLAWWCEHRAEVFAAFAVSD